MIPAGYDLNNIELIIYDDKARISGTFDLAGLKRLEKIVAALEDILAPSSPEQTVENSLGRNQ